MADILKIYEIQNIGKGVITGILPENLLQIGGGGSQQFDVFVTSGTYAGGTATFTNNIGNTFDVTGFNTSSGITNTSDIGNIPKTIDSLGNLSTSLVNEIGNVVYIGTIGTSGGPSISIDFESGIIAPMTSVTANPWYVASGISHSGNYAAKSGPISDNSSTIMSYTYSGSATMSLWYKVSTESNYDKLYIRVNGVDIMTPASGEIGWTKLTYPVSGNSVISFTYVKDSSSSSGADAVWIDDVVFTSASQSWVQSTKFVKTGGLPIEFLMADGSVSLGTSGGTGASYWSAGTGTSAIATVDGGNTANGLSAIAMGYNTSASGDYSHSEGIGTIASGVASHAEGQYTRAGGIASHAEGQGSTAIGESAHAEGSSTARGDYSHSQGDNTQSIGMYSHAGGYGSYASGDTSFVHGYNSQCNGTNTIVFGQNMVGNLDNTVYVDRLNIKTLPVFVDNSAAASLELGTVYRTSTGQLMVKY